MRKLHHRPTVAVPVVLFLRVGKTRLSGTARFGAHEIFYLLLLHYHHRAFLDLSFQL